MHLAQLVRSTLDDRKNISPASRNLGPVEISATRNDLLNWLYRNGVVEASPYSAHLSDKLFFGKLMRAALPDARLVPLSLRLGELPATREWRARLFPQGFVVKPTSSMASDGEGIYFNGEDFFSSGVKLPTELAVNELTGSISSGEKLLAQENLGAREREYRLHTLENYVVKGATYSRWDQDWDRSTFARAEVALENFLSALPIGITARQAWGVDLMERVDGSFGIVEINTNRGREKHWSGDLANPDTLRAYVLQLEAHYGAEFLGASGEEFRGARAGLKKYEEDFSPAARGQHDRLRSAYITAHGSG